MLKAEISKKTFSVALIFSLVLPTVCSVAFNLYMDPFQIFFTDSNDTTSFIGGRGRDRYQHVGVARNYNPGSIIIGNSYAANFYPTHVENILGWPNVYSLTLDGGHLYEQSRVANLALSSSDVENILWLLAPGNLSAPPKATNKKMPFPDYLYNDSRVDDIKLFATSTSEFYKYVEIKNKKALALTDESRAKGVTIDPRDRSTEWASKKEKSFNDPKHILRLFFEKTKANQTRSINNKSAPVEIPAELTTLEPLELSEIMSLRLEGGGLKIVASNIAQNLQLLIESHQESNFNFIVHPPFPQLLWQRAKATGSKEYLRTLSIIKYFVNEFSKYDNVRIFAFGNEPFTSDLRLYKDTHHYHSVMNDYMLHAIEAGKNRVDMRNVNSYLLDFDRLVTNYRYEPSAYHSEAPGLTVDRARTILVSHTSEHAP